MPEPIRTWGSVGNVVPHIDSGVLEQNLGSDKRMLGEGRMAESPLANSGGSD